LWRNRDKLAVLLGRCLIPIYLHAMTPPCGRSRDTSPLLDAAASYGTFGESVVGLFCSFDLLGAQG